MKLNEDEQAMRAGELGEAARWGIEGQVRFGAFFDAPDFVPVRQSHLMGDTEAIGPAAFATLARLADLPPAERRMRALAVTENIGVDTEAMSRLGHHVEAFDRHGRALDALDRLGVVVGHAYVNFHSVVPPGFGELTAFGSTPTAIYVNSVLGARTNFEGGPAALAAAFTGRVPRYGFHLDENRRGTDLFVVDDMPRDLTDWGMLGAEIGSRLADYAKVPVIDGLTGRPDAAALTTLGACLATYGSHGMFHVVGVTPEARDAAEAFHGQPVPAAAHVGRAALDARYAAYDDGEDGADVVVLGAPMLHSVELAAVADMIAGRRVHGETALLVFTAPEVLRQARATGVAGAIEDAGGMILTGLEFFQIYPRELGATRGWRRLVTNSPKLAQIIPGYGYVPRVLPFDGCVEAAVAGRVAR
ncbi:MAG: aconitase X [Acetobacterales bacterium]